MTNKPPHIIHIFPSFGRGGVPIKICHSINYFGRRARHTIISTNNDFGAEDIIQDGLDVAIDKTHHDIRDGFFGRLKRHRHYLKNARADLLITYNWGSVEWALANSFGPIMHHIHVESGFGPDEAIGTKTQRDVFRRFALRNIDYLSVPSNTLITIARKKWGIPDRKIKYIPNGVDLEKFSSDLPVKHLGDFVKSDNEVIVGTIAPLRPEKNISRMIRSFAKTPEQTPNTPTRLVIMGDGVEKPKLEALVAELGLTDNVIFTGHVSEPAKAINLLDIFAISSDTEQMPNAVNEAMAAGLPVVGLAVGDVKHMVSDANEGYIADAGDEDGFSEKMMELILNEKDRQTIGEANLDHVRKHYDRIEMYQKYAELWGIS